MKVKDKVESKRNPETKSLQLNFASQMLDNEFPDIKDLASRLHFSPVDGRIWLDDSRMILLHNEAFGALRQELIESLGIELARGLLTRMGYLAGFKDAALARKIRPNDTQMNMFMVGPQLHSLEGIVFVEPIRMEMDSETGHFYCECLWKDSSEDESHIAIYGLGSEPACWMQIGYASGYCSAFMGKRILFRETECASMGAAHCRVVGKPVENWENAEQDLKYMQAQPLKPANTSKITVKTVITTALSKDIATSQLNSPSVVVGASAGYFGVIHRINRVANTRATVLLLGESGVGKSMFASEIHRNSGRADQPFIEVNCAAIPEELLESELFGVDKGAYTGATEAREGKFEAADGGTLFLDEIALLSLTAQSKLLRVLQTGELEHLGSTKTRKVDVRVVAATNENLNDAIEQGRFRKDLYYRLNVFPIVIPPLRERRADIPLLLEKLLKEFCERHGRQISGITDRAMQTLLTHPWLGNIRELENVLERGIILADDGGALDLIHLFSPDENQAAHTQHGLNDVTLPLTMLPHTYKSSTALWANQIVQRQDVTLGEIEEALMQASLKAAQGNISKAASLLGISRAQMDYRVKKSLSPKKSQVLM